MPAIIRPDDESYEVCYDCGRRLRNPRSLLCAFCSEVLRWFDPLDGRHIADDGRQEEEEPDDAC
jgi:hypothetical protein